ncbi:Stk1 family PASTA domain-containing Ser/Thr kinase [Rubeoparvulum massiliense]|uniref:Stk1 family PASTA domain-containing Ser/Thr kinase n=1 Tax=Rubeoparvulum massiliense TaxID=1631346 RepID=UPI00065DF9F9|nr:Stk1 family PASTA domain-containing Ser/Thr kinase [Rubeoparvulum massiliense]
MIGQCLGQRYDVLERIGGGGMAIVYRGYDRLLGREVAIKVLRPQFASDDEFKKRFFREAQAAASLSHPNVVNIYDVGEVPGEEIHYIVMEYVDGYTLKEYIQQKGHLSDDEAVPIAIKICDALVHAHQRQLIHRDIKPHNILIGKDGRIKVTDFGIARAATAATITHTNTLMGSVHYLSPEQARGGMTGEKSDLYSLGVVLYEMVTGELPFSGDSPITVALQHLQAPFKEPREINPDIRQSVENVILKALVKNPAYRYQSAQEMLDDLRTVLAPSRRNEEKFLLPEMDDEETKILPNWRQELNAHLSSSSSFGRIQSNDSENADDQIDEDRGHGGRKSWVKPAIWVGSILVVIVLLLIMGQWIKAKLWVPEVEVPSVDQLELEEALSLLDDHHLLPKVVEENDNLVEENHIIRQDPQPGTSVKENTEVLLVVSKGKKAFDMPSLVGMQEKQAIALLDGYKSYDVKHEVRRDIPVGQVFAQDPGPNVKVVPSEQNVVLYVSEGEKVVEMPELMGLTVPEAEALLLERNLEVGDIHEQPSYLEKGKVFKMAPYESGEEVDVGSKVNLWVSSGYPSDAQVIVKNITVNPTHEGATIVNILVRDARGMEIYAVSEQSIDSPTVFPIELVLSPQKNATITTYLDGSEAEVMMVEYTGQ